MTERMTSDNYQSNMLRSKSSQYHIDKIDPDLLHAAMGCETEVGEIMDAIKKTIFYGKPLDIVNIKEEFGDLLWYIALGLHYCGCNFDEVMTANISKLKARYPDKFTSEASMFRDLDKERGILEQNYKEQL